MLQVLVIGAVIMLIMLAVFSDLEFLIKAMSIILLPAVLIMAGVVTVIEYLGETRK
jgi:hypothetical protein